VSWEGSTTTAAISFDDLGSLGRDMDSDPSMTIEPSALTTITPSLHRAPLSIIPISTFYVYYEHFIRSPASKRVIRQLKGRHRTNLNAHIQKPSYGCTILARS
jgi:hypothetical protein